MKSESPHKSKREEIRSADTVVDFLSKSEEGMSDGEKLKRQMFRFGLDPLLLPIRGDHLPAIVTAIDRASTRRSDADATFLRSELALYGIDLGSVRLSFWSEAKYILCKIAGLTEIENRQTMSIRYWDSRKMLENYLIGILDYQLQKRSEFMLNNPDLDWRTERVGTRKIHPIKESLKMIYDITGLRPLEIFDKKHIPEYNPRKNYAHKKSHLPRSLGCVLDELSSALSNPNWKEIENKTGNTKTNIIRNLTNRLFGGVAVKVFSNQIIKAFCETRVRFQDSPQSKLYPKDTVDYSAILAKLASQSDVI